MLRRLTLIIAVALVAQTALAEETAKPVPPKPKINKIKKETDKLAIVITPRPGVPDAAITFDLEIELFERLTSPDPTYGSRRPVTDAEVSAYLVSPTETTKGKKSTHWAQGHRAHRMPDAGAYAFTFTPPTPGVYGLYLRGTAAEAGPIDFSVMLPVGVWPIPEAASIPELPTPMPVLTAGNLEHGKALCAERCRRDLPQSLPSGGMPEFIHSDFAAALDEAALLKTMTVADAKPLTPIQHGDLVAYLHSLHWTMTDLFPEARAYIAKEFKINEHGRERLETTLKTKFDDQELSGVVFVAYKMENAGESLRFIRYDDRVGRDQLKRKNKLGYLVFLSIPKEPKATELALAITKEPDYKIAAIIARDAAGRQDDALNKQLKSFIGEGHFNDAKSLKKGAPALQAKLLPVYLKAAELATMYYGDERDFTAFDDEFGGTDDVSVENQEVKLKNK